MLKKLLFAAVAALVAASCSKTSSQMAPVSVHVEDFRITVDHISDTKSVGDLTDYEDVKAITLAFYDGTTELYKATQYYGDAGFGTFNCSLPVGSAKMVVLGYGFFTDDVLTLTSPTVAAFTSDHVRETFSCVKDVTVSGTSTNNFSATLERIVSKLIVISSDTKIEGAAKIRMSFSSSSKAFNPTTGLASGTSGFSNTVNVSSAVGAVSSSVSFLFLNSDEQDLDVTISVLNSSGDPIVSKTVTGVPFKRNRCTQLTGPVYTPLASASSFQLDPAWLTQEEVTF